MLLCCLGVMCAQLLSTHREVLIHEVLERNWVPRLLDWLNLTDLPAVQVCRKILIIPMSCPTSDRVPACPRPFPRRCAWNAGGKARGRAFCVHAVACLLFIAPSEAPLRTLVRSCLTRASPRVQVEALWALTNIAAGTTEHTHVLLRHNPVPALVRLLDSSNQEVLEQALWVIGNIAGEVRQRGHGAARGEGRGNVEARGASARRQRKASG